MNVVVNDKDTALAEGATVLDLVDGLDLKGQPVAVELNRDVVPRTLHGTTVLKDGDRVEVVTLVGGG
ncbi:MAG: sulfur carrier protein ThiS [Deltaproteobacteria bacterium]|nr:sulfur carrier protein ThiS [Deltaproteobacteria bacterium]